MVNNNYIVEKAIAIANKPNFKNTTNDMVLWFREFRNFWSA